MIIFELFFIFAFFLSLWDSILGIAIATLLELADKDEIIINKWLRFSTINFLVFITLFMIILFGGMINEVIF